MKENVMNVEIIQGRKFRRCRFKRYMSASIPLQHGRTPLLDTLPLGKHILNQEQAKELIYNPMTNRQTRVLIYAIQDKK